MVAGKMPALRCAAGPCPIDSVRTADPTVRSAVRTCPWSAAGRRPPWQRSIMQGSRFRKPASYPPVRFV